MNNIDAINHAQGKSVYVDDVREQSGTLFGVPVLSKIAHGRILSITLAEDEGLVGLFTAKDILGENQVGSIIQDEELLASEEVHYMGQPVALLVARSYNHAMWLREMVEVEYEELTPIVDPKEAFQNGSVIGEIRTFSRGSVELAWAECDLVVTDEIHIGGQEHLYIETQGAYAIPTEGGIKVISSTQGPTAVQRGVSRVLDIPMHKVEVDVRRLGGGFGGKEDQATPVACLAALGSALTGSPVKVIINRHDDMQMTGKRHPYVVEYKLGLRGDKLHAYEVTFYQNAGAACDLSPAVLERTLFHACGSYFIPHVRARGISCRTNLPPNTAFRGFGGPQGMFAIEAAIHHASTIKKVHPETIQLTNLIGRSQSFHYGQSAENVTISEIVKSFDHSADIQELEQFNSRHKFKKRGYAIMPVTFGISFTNKSMNQAGALVQIYSDGSVGVSTGAVEMGQGVNTRILQVVASSLGITPNIVKMETTNTTRVANTSPSAASSTHDLNGKAALDATSKIMARLRKFAKEHFGSSSFEIRNGLVDLGNSTMEWGKFVFEAHLARVDLAAHGFYRTPVIHFDKSTETGHPFAYHTCGVAYVEAELDLVRGVATLRKAKILHDSGKLQNSIIDLGQIEGGFIQGLGWMLIEDLVFSDRGRLLSNTLSTYKVPDISFIPDVLEVRFFEGHPSELGLAGSKAVGEPPLMYGIAGYFAVRDAMSRAKDLKLPYVSPLTPERILLGLYGD